MICRFCGSNPCHPDCDFLEVQRKTFSIKEPGMGTANLEECDMGTKCDRNLPYSEEKASDVQVGGNHYKDCAIQPVDYILENGLGYLEGNVIKYVTRHDKKNGLQDLEKARHYIDLIIEKKYK